jgi:hypothetical protein
MNELEERLRTDLRAAAAQVEDRIDTDDALLAGQRARSSRRIARTVGVGALAAAVALVGWGFLGAAPVLGGHPDPMGTVSATTGRPSTSSSPYVPTDPMAATFEIGGRLNGQVNTYDSVGVFVKPDGDQVGVAVVLSTATKKAGRSIVSNYTFTSGAFWQVALDKHLVLAIVPGRPSWFTAADNPVKGAVTDQQPLTGINATAYLIGYIEAGGPDTVRGFLWHGTDGVVQDSLGNLVPSAEVVLADDTYWVYRDTALDLMGIEPRKEGNGYSFRLSDVKAGDLVHGGIGSRPDKGEWTWTQFGTLPPGAHDLKVVLAQPGAEWGSATLSDGWVFVVAHAVTTKTKVITSLTYTDADGKVVTARR